MKRLVALPAIMVLLAGCGGGGGGATPSAHVATSGMQSGTLGLTIGAQAGTSSSTRQTKFVSPNAATAVIDVNNGTPQNFDVSATSSLCTTANNVRTCAIPLTAPVGQDSIFVALKTAAGVTLGSGSNSVVVVAGTTFSLTVGINPVVAGANAITFSPSPSFQLGTASTITGTVTFADPSGAPITGSGNVPNFLTPITLTSSDPHITFNPASLTTPGQTFTAHYDGSGAVASSVTITAMSGTTMVASGPVIVPGLIVTRYNLAAITAPGTIFPAQIVVGPDNNIWWTEESTHRIGHITPGAPVAAPGIVYANSTIGGAVGLAVGGDGNLWYSNNATTIARITTGGVAPLTGPASIVVGAAGSSVGRLATDSQGNVWFINGGLGYSIVGYVDAVTFTVHTFGSTPTPNALQSFGGLTLGADKAMWFTEESYPTVQKIGRITTPANGVAGNYTEYASPNSGALTYPTDITGGSDGKIWYSEFDGTANAPGQFYANFVPGAAINITEFPNAINPAAFANLVTIFAGADGNIWLAEGGGAVKVIPSNPTMPITQFFTDNGQTSMVNCISGTTPDGNLWCTAYGGASLGPPFINTTDAILTWKPR